MVPGEGAVREQDECAEADRARLGEDRGRASRGEDGHSAPMRWGVHCAHLGLGATHAASDDVATEQDQTEDSKAN